jgi:sRNA-binding carbon storage regulator CsrA
MDNKAELIIMALQQRIGELVSNYETQVAVLRAEITQYSQEQEEKQKAAEDYSQSLEDKLNN